MASDCRQGVSGGLSNDSIIVGKGGGGRNGGVVFRNIEAKFCKGNDGT